MAESGPGSTGLQRVGSVGPGQQAMAAISALRQKYVALPAKRRSWLLACALFLAAACAGMTWYAERPDWRVLFSGLEAKDLQQVSQELAAAGVPYEMSADGSGIEVPAEMLDKARMEVASKGMPQTGRLGFELFDKPNWVGSEFDERVNYQRALEGELEHTIETLSAVRSARVHLVLPQQSLFSGESRLAKASVVLKLKRATMDPEQVEAIRSLVAGSVENLSVEQVTLVDADGKVSLKARSNDAAQGDVEQAMEAKLIAMLEPLAGRDNVRATVHVSYDEDSEEQTDEVYDPAAVATLSMQRSDQSAPGGARAQGVPGTASNSPAGSAAGAVAGSQTAAAPGTPPLLQKQALPVYPQNNALGQTLHQENGTYAVTKHVIHRQAGPGRVKRVSAAVVVNDKASIVGAGKMSQTVWKARSADELHRLELLAQAAVGFDTKRGDQLVVENIGFSSNAPEMKPALLERSLEEVQAFLHTQPGMLRTLMAGLCGVLLVLFVLKPVAQQVNATLREPLQLTSSKTTEELQIGTDREHEGEPVVAKGRAIQPSLLEYVAENILREPAQSTRLLESWIAQDERGSN